MSKQVIYVNFYGAQELEYRNLQTGTIISDISMTDAGISEAGIAQILALLNEANGDYTFVSDPAGLPEGSYSTIYVGESDAFDEFGAIKGISETTGVTAAETANDNAFVLTQNIKSMEDLVETIQHEAGHLTGALVHDAANDGVTIDDFMATYSTAQTVAEGESKTFTEDTFRRNNEYVSQITNNGTLILTGVTCTSNRANQGGALSNYGTATITNSTFSSNYGEYLGGAIYNWGEATLYISNTFFTYNSSINGKAIYNDGTIIIDGLITLDVGQNIFNNATITVNGSKFDFSNGAFAKAIDGYDNWCLGKGTVFQGTYDATSGYYVYFDDNDGDLYVGNSSMIAVVADSNSTEVTVNGVTYKGQYYSTVSLALTSGRKTIALSGTTQNARLNIREGITLASSGTLFNSGSSAENGGALYNKGLVELESVTFNDNSTSSGGGAIYNSIGARAVINGGAFHGNTTSYSGGAIYNDRGPLSVGTVTITGSTFDKNSSKNHGGAVLNSGMATIIASTFTDNDSSIGGAINSFDTATITSSTFIENTATKRGGAINNVASGGGAGTITISGSTFSKNTAGINGGAICSDTSAEITGSTFSGNSAVEYGGAICSNVSTSLFVANSIFSDNVSDRGGAIFNNGTATISDSTFSGNAGAIYNNRTATISNLTFTGNTGAIYNKDILNIEGLITLTTASDTIYNGSSITVDGSKFDYTNGPVRVVDAFDANWLESGSNNFTVTDGYWLYRDDDNIDLYITNQLTTAVVTQDGSYAVTVNGTTYNGPRFDTIDAALSAGASTVAAEGITLTARMTLFQKKTIVLKDISFSEVSYDGMGGAIYNYGDGEWIIQDSTFNGNSATSGGAIANDGKVTISNSTFSGNSASGNGGAIYNDAGTMTISDCTFTANTAADGGGGAIYNFGTVTISNSTFDGNSAQAGGAIFNQGNMHLSNTSFLTDTDTIANVGTMSLSGKMIFRGNLLSPGVLTATDAEIEFSGKELYGAISASGNSSLTFTNTAQADVYGLHTGFTSIGFAGTTVSFSDAQDWSGVNITIANHTVIDGSELSLVVATGSFTLDGANFTVNGVSVTLGNSFTINGKEYQLSYNNTDLILKREFLVINSDGGSDFVSVADLFLAHPDYTGTIKVTGGTFTKNEFFNGCENVISNLNSNYSIYGGKNGSAAGDVNLNIDNSTVNMVFGGSSNGKNGVVTVTFTNSSANYLYATALGETNGTTLILNNSTVAKEIQGSTLNSDNIQGSMIQMNGGSYGGSDYFFVYTGLKVASAGNTDLLYSQFGDSLLTLKNVTLNDKSHLFAGGYGYGAGNAKAEAHIIGNTSIEVTGCTINGSVSIYGGGRTDGFGFSYITGNTSITVSGITVSTGSTLNIFGGGYNNSSDGYENIAGDVTITVSGANNINGKLNIYGGGINIGSGTSTLNYSIIQIGTAGMTDRISLNNVYGGGIGNVNVNGGSSITFAGRGQITMSGILSGDGVTAGNVGGSKSLNFDRFSGTLGAIAVKNFDVVNLDANSSVIFSNRLNLATVSTFCFTIDEERVWPETAILEFVGGVSKWDDYVGISVEVGDGVMVDGTTLTLISALDSLDGWVGKAINLTTKSGLSDNLWTAVIGEDIFDAASGNTYRFDLVDFDNNGHMDGLQMTMTSSNGGGLPSALSDMVNALALDNLSLGSEAGLDGILDLKKQNNGMLA